MKESWWVHISDERNLEIGLHILDYTIPGNLRLKKQKKGEICLFERKTGWKSIYCSGRIFSLVFICFRNWNRWKQWRHQRQAQQQRDAASNDDDVQVSADEETGDVPDGQLCVICLTRRKRAAFVPCGHLVCCQRCALSVERDLAPKCPLCRQTIHSSVRIYYSWWANSYELFWVADAGKVVVHL